MPNYENLLNAKKFHIKKLIKNVRTETANTLILNFNAEKLYSLQLEQKLKITPETIRNCLFFLIQSPQKIQINFKKGACKLSFVDSIDCESAFSILKSHILKREKSSFERITKIIVEKISAIFSCCLRGNTLTAQDRTKRKQMTSNLMERSSFLFAYNGKKESKDTGEIIEEVEPSRIESIE